MDVASEASGSMVKASVAAKDVDAEAGGSKGRSSGGKHYIPVLELFRGHWFGIIVQSCYEACECVALLKVVGVPGCQQY